MTDVLSRLCKDNTLPLEWTEVLKDCTMNRSDVATQLQTLQQVDTIQLELDTKMKTQTCRIQCPWMYAARISCLEPRRKRSVSDATLSSKRRDEARQRARTCMAPRAALAEEAASAMAALEDRERMLRCPGPLKMSVVSEPDKVLDRPHPDLLVSMETDSVFLRLHDGKVPFASKKVDAEVYRELMLLVILYSAAFPSATYDDRTKTVEECMKIHPQGALLRYRARQWAPLLFEPERISPDEFRQSRNMRIFKQLISRPASSKNKAISQQSNSVASTSPSWNRSQGRAVHSTHRTSSAWSSATPQNVDSKHEEDSSESTHRYTHEHLITILNYAKEQAIGRRVEPIAIQKCIDFDVDSATDDLLQRAIRAVENLGTSSPDDGKHDSDDACSAFWYDVLDDAYQKTMDRALQAQTEWVDTLRESLLSIMTEMMESYRVEHDFCNVDATVMGMFRDYYDFLAEAIKMNLNNNTERNETELYNVLIRLTEDYLTQVHKNLHKDDLAVQTKLRDSLASSELNTAHVSSLGGLCSMFSILQTVGETIVSASCYNGLPDQITDMNRCIAVAFLPPVKTAALDSPFYQQLRYRFVTVWPLVHCLTMTLNISGAKARFSNLEEYIDLFKQYALNVSSMAFHEAVKVCISRLEDKTDSWIVTDFAAYMMYDVLNIPTQFQRGYLSDLIQNVSFWKKRPSASRDVLHTFDISSQQHKIVVDTINVAIETQLSGMEKDDVQNIVSIFDPSGSTKFGSGGNPLLDYIHAAAYSQSAKWDLPHTSGALGQDPFSLEDDKVDAMLYGT